MKDQNNLKHNSTTEKAKIVTLSELQPEIKSGNKLLNNNYSIISDLKLDLEVILGTAELTVKELFDLHVGSTVELDQTIETQLTLRINGKPIAFGTLVVVGDNFGIQITDIIDSAAKVT